MCMTIGVRVSVLLAVLAAGCHRQAVPGGFEPSGGLLIVAPESFRLAVERYAAGRRADGAAVWLATVEEIDRTEEGNDLPERIRNRVTSVHERDRIGYLLLAGGYRQVPARLIYNPDWYATSLVLAPAEVVSLSERERDALDEHRRRVELVVGRRRPEQTLIPSDHYYADLTGDWDVNRDGVHGQGPAFAAMPEGSFRADIAVGRIPAATVEELARAFDRLLRERPASDFSIRLLPVGARIDDAAVMRAWLDDEETLAALTPAAFDYRRCRRTAECVVERTDGPLDLYRLFLARVEHGRTTVGEAFLAARALWLRRNREASAEEWLRRVAFGCLLIGDPSLWAVRYARPPLLLPPPN